MYVQVYKSKPKLDYSYSVYWILVLGFPLQTSMSVALTMVAVLTTVPTPRALSHAAAEVDSS